MIGTYANTAAQVLAGNVCLEAAANWIVKHENKPDSEQMPLLPGGFKKPEGLKPSITREEIKENKNELREPLEVEKKEEDKKQTEKEKKVIMGKKVKKKTRSGHKDKRAPSTFPGTVTEQGASSAEITDNGIAGIKDGALCSHMDKGTNLDKLSAKLGSSESLKCEDCRENVVDRGAKRGKGKRGKKGLNSKSESKAIWICLECGHFSCGGVGLPTTPQSHAVRHAKQNHHPLVVHYVNHQLVWCFPCNKLIPVEKSEDSRLKEAINEVVKLMKGRPGEGSTVDVEDVWFGSGSVTSAMKSDVSSSTAADGRVGYSVRGLVNLGNTCFFNSIMQNLLAINGLRDYFFKLDESVGSLSAALRKLFLETSTESSLKGVINPRSFFGSLCTKAPQFRGYQQHDSHELLRCLLDGLSTEELSTRNHTKSSQAPITDPTFIDAIFGGQLSSTVSCLECGHSSTIYEPFLDLSLPVPTKKPPARRIQQVSRGKKTKLPPKKSGRNLSKTSREANPSAGGSVSGQSISANEVQSLAQPAEQLMLSADPNTIALDMGLTAQDLSAVQKPTNEQAVENAGEQSISSDSFSWLDYVEVEPNPVSHDVDMVSETEEISAIKVVAHEDALQNDVSLSVPLNSNTESNLVNAYLMTSLDNALDQGVVAKQENDISQYEDKLNEKPQLNEGLSGEGFSSEEVGWNDSNIGHSSDSCNQGWPKDLDTSGRDNENPPQIQDSEVILLPYREDTSSSVEVPRSEVEASSAVLDDNQHSLDFDGFGDLFNEPEVSVELKHPVDKNGVTGNSSASDPDEVDNADAPVSVESCLAFFTRPELLSKDEHAWQCDNCSKTLRKQRIRSMKKLQMPISEIVPNSCEDRNPSGLLGDEGTCNEVKSMNQNLESDLIDPSGLLDASLPQQNREGYENGKCMLGKHAETGINLIDGRSSEDTDPQTIYACHGPSESSSFSNQNFNPSLGEYDPDKGEFAESNLLSAKSELEVSEEEEVKSENVKVKRDATKSILINKAPSILTIHLKRFSQDVRGRLSKLNGHVNFRETIDLKPYMDPRCTDRDVFTYRLVGVVEHLGTMRGGHYVAYVRGTKNSGDSVWYYASDAHVREASFEEVRRCEAYILFYEGT